MQDSIKRLSVMIGIIVLLAVIGTFFFMGVEKLALPDAFALTISTLSTVGWADTAGLSTASKVFCTFLSIGAITVVVGFIATFSQRFFEGSIQDFLGRRKMDQKIQKLKGHYIICGFGLTGKQIAKDLQYEGKDFVVIDNSAERCVEAGELGYLYVNGNATEEENLKRAVISRATGLFSILSQDSDNLLTVLSARGLNENLKIVSRVTSDELRERFERAGANMVVSYIDWASRNMLSAMIKPHTLDLLTLLFDASVNQTHLEEISIPDGSHIVGKSLQESGIKQATGIYVMGYACPEENKLLTNPPPETILKKGDIIVGMGTREGFTQLKNYISR